MSVCRDFNVSRVVATSTSLICVPTYLGTSRSFRFVLYLIVTECCNLTSLVVIAILAISAFSTLSLTAGCYGLSPVAVGVSVCRDFNVGCVVATSTSLVGIPSYLGAGCFLCRMLNLIVSKSRYLTGFVMIAVLTISTFLTLRSASGSSCFYPSSVRVSVRRNFNIGCVIAS